MATEQKRLLVRRGNQSDLVATDLLPGEPVLALDTNTPGIKGSGGEVIWGATRSGAGNTIPMEQGGLGTNDPSQALVNLGLVSSTIASGTGWKLSIYGKIVCLQIYGAKPSDIPAISAAYRPKTVDAAGFAWILSDPTQAGALTVAAYNGAISSFSVTGPNQSGTECRASISWII